MAKTTFFLDIYLLRLKLHCNGLITIMLSVTVRAGFTYRLHGRGGQTCSMYEPHIVKPKLQRAAT